MVTASLLQQPLTRSVSVLNSKELKLQTSRELVPSSYHQMSLDFSLLLHPDSAAPITHLAAIFSRLHAELRSAFFWLRPSSAPNSRIRNLVCPRGDVFCPASHKSKRQGEGRGEEEVSLLFIALCVCVCVYEQESSIQPPPPPPS